jgi:hypothetical protein
MGAALRRHYACEDGPAVPEKESAGTRAISGLDQKSIDADSQKVRGMPLVR